MIISALAFFVIFLVMVESVIVIMIALEEYSLVLMLLNSHNAFIRVMTNFSLFCIFSIVCFYTLNKLNLSQKLHCGKTEALRFSSCIQFFSIFVVIYIRIYMFSWVIQCCFQFWHLEKVQLVHL